MKKLLLLVMIASAVMIGILGKTGGAQEGNRSGLTWETFWENRRDIIAEAMQLTEHEAETFWPIYENYAQEMMALDKRTADMIAAYVHRPAQLSDTDAEAIVAELLDIREDEVTLMRRYLEELTQVLPLRKVLRFFQIENTLDTLVEMEIVKQVPLAAP